MPPPAQPGNVVADAVVAANGLVAGDDAVLDSEQAGVVENAAAGAGADGRESPYWTLTPASPTDRLSDNTTLARLNVPPEWKMPPPMLPWTEFLSARPRVIVRPRTVTFMVAAHSTSKTRVTPLPLTANFSGPGPLTVRLSVTFNCPPLKVIVPWTEGANWMVSGPRCALAAATACAMSRRRYRTR